MIAEGRRPARAASMTARLGLSKDFPSRKVGLGKEKRDLVGN